MRGLPPRFPCLLIICSMARQMYKVKNRETSQVLSPSSGKERESNRSTRVLMVKGFET